ncbi:MAG: Nif11-like leader peptide family natural product precursor [Aphanothece sp. CMT-3BRIN-NPC111]|jgi:predicted ribosomally synthesized peptide with nif11-like leader|nr:Nif11-like leader peptide family natural product precursor [Aphanothece sp. CMT-3BRIN-NPC111]
MAQESAARFFNAVKQDQALKQKLKATTDPESFVQIAAQRGYNFTTEELQAQIAKLSAEEMAAVINPGVGPRRHIVPR